MKFIRVVTGNSDKYEEIRKILEAYGIKSEHVKLSFPETEDTVEEISIEKAKNAFSIVKKPLIVDDTGVFFDAYKNFPGHLAKRIYQSIGFEGLLKLLEGEPRGALFKTVVCYIDGKTLKVFVGELRGLITNKVYPSRRVELPYEQIFIPDGFDKPLCFLTTEEKNKISHRSRAVRKFAEWYSNK